MTRHGTSLSKRRLTSISQNWVDPSGKGLKSLGKAVTVVTGAENGHETGGNAFD